jgi:ribonuclease I
MFLQVYWSTSFCQEHEKTQKQSLKEKSKFNF